jgi:hypothetical protein
MTQKQHYPNSFSILPNKAQEFQNPGKPNIPASLMGAALWDEASSPFDQLCQE